MNDNPTAFCIDCATPADGNTPDETFVRKLLTELFNQYSTLDKLAEHIAKDYKTRDMPPYATLGVVDVRIEPCYDHVAIHYTLVTDGILRYRTSETLQWETFLAITDDSITPGHNPWILQGRQVGGIPLERIALRDIRDNP